MKPQQLEAHVHELASLRRLGIRPDTWMVLGSGKGGLG